MADNDGVVKDPDEPGAFDDWIELHNTGSTAVDLSGMYLSDDAEEPTKWQFPDGSTIDAGGYLIIWADDDTDQGDNHASFKLSADGESVLLYDTDAVTLIDSVDFGEQATDVSYGRSPDDSSMFAVLATATPGAANIQDIPGDANRDGEVTFADFLILSSNFGKQVDAVWADGDFDGDGMVSFADFLILSANFAGD